ncbi:MAG: HD domain-containing protein [Candidatus Omnitrophica bacterium]|nr:HD domain-containing protein [Candidatus Omnitrophota bacterium]
MLEKIEEVFRDIISTLQIAKLYTVEHPRFKKYLDKTYTSLQEALKEKPELIIGIVGEEFAFEKEIFFDLSRLSKPTISYLKERKIEKIIFYRALTKEELSRFFHFLTLRKDEIKQEPHECLAVMGVKNIIVGKIEALKSGAGAGGGGELFAEKTPEFLYNDYLEQVNNSVDAVINKQPLDQLNLRFTVLNVMENLTTKYKEFLKLTTVKRYDLQTFAHILNVSILSMYFSAKLGLTRDDVLDIGTAALFHDIGKLYISRKIIQKPDRLTDEEFSKIKSHVTVGSEILLRYVDSLGILPVVVAFEHHLKFDLKGYPKLSFFQEPHVASLIVSICDVYDALFQRRSYKNDYSPDAIYALMKNDRNKAFEPVLLDMFFKIFGVWPIGTLLRLDNGSVGVVREENESDIFLPKVEIVYPENNGVMVDLKEHKNDLKIERFLNPIKEGKEYMPFI